MSEALCSVGIDVGTTSTQMVLSRLTVENRAGSFAVPEMTIEDRQILWVSPVLMTPLLDESHIDAAALGLLVEEQYRAAGICREQVDTGAIIITGETARKDNARAVLEALSRFAGDFVVATAGPDLESVLAARGAGAAEFSRDTGKTVLHMDIGGGTANLALLREGEIIQTGCLNVGGHLVTMDREGKITWVSPALTGLFPKRAGDRLTREEAMRLAELLTRGLEMAAGLRPATELLDRLQTPGAGKIDPPEGAVISFSGGVADCIGREFPWLAFGDLGPELGTAIRKSRLCQGQFMLGKETIRATVIGAGCHSTRLSGSTVFCQNMTLPLQDLPVARSAEGLGRLEEGVLALPGIPAPGYDRVRELAREVAQAFRGRSRVLVVLEQDMAKALGQALALLLGREAQILCIDRLRLAEGDYLNVGQPVGPAFPVVVKTLILSK